MGCMMGFDNEDDVHPQMIPEGVVDFINEAIGIVAENTGTDEVDIIFQGLVLNFTVKGKPITFQAMKVS